MTDELLNLSEACKILKVSYSKGVKLAKAHALPFKKLGSTWIISRSTLYRELGLESELNKEEEQKCA